MTDTSFTEKLKIDITVLVTSIYQREITIETANYYSKICSEVILIDEEQPYLSDIEISILKKKGITYIPHEASRYKGSYESIFKKRLIAAKQSQKRYVVHSNHDERYTYHGLLACLTELEKDKKLAFCAGQAIAVRKDFSEIYYTRSYKNLCGYQNLNDKVEQRLYHHAKIYSPIAHYAVWRREFYINTAERTLSTYELMPSRSTMLDEVIFELAADLAGNSKAIPDLYWIRNRINPPTQHQQEYENGEYTIEIIKNKLNIMLKDLDNIQLDVVINNLLNSFPSFRSKSFLEKSIILIKLRMPNIIKKNTRRIEGVDDIYTLLNYNKIKYEKNDLNNLLNSMSL
jgi:hypothetical protein